MYKEDLALNNLQWLISHKTKPVQILDLSYSSHLCIGFTRSEMEPI